MKLRRKYCVAGLVVKWSARPRVRAILLFIPPNDSQEYKKLNLAIIEGPRDALGQMKSCLQLHSCTNIHLNRFAVGE